jgi:uncharacterized membrane protein YjjP (DUF1212 family)
MGSGTERKAASEDALALVAGAAKLLFENGQTTQRTAAAVEQLGAALGFRAGLFPQWGELIVRAEGRPEPREEIVAAEPLGVDMRKVAETGAVIDALAAGRIDAAAARSALEKAARLPPISLIRFALLAGAGAAALGVIFGSTHVLTLAIIAASAAAGALVRRGLGAISANPFVQPLCAALLAGVVGAIGADAAMRLVAVCPCMVLVPGPHFLNGMIDLARARIALGVARVVYASMITLAISAGLLIGLALGGADLPVFEPASAVPFGYDVIAAGVAVAAYGTFFAMPWRMLPIPIAIGMIAHAARWAIIAYAGASPAGGALAACLIVGTVITPIADWLRLPFAAVAFASVVSMIPGVFIFRMAGGLLALLQQGGGASTDLMAGVVVDGTTALFIILAISFGLILPKIGIEYFFPAYLKASP